MNGDSSLNPFFNPQGVVLVGASTNPMKLGFGLARNLLQSHYRGAIHFVNPGGGVLLGHPLYVALSDVPDPVDLAVLLVPAAAAPQALLDCAQRGIRAVIIASGGFREVGDEGAALEAKCLQIAHEHGLRLIGPNCIGLLDTHLPLDTTFLPPPGPTPGDVAFISHSGAICAAVIDWARGQGFGLSRLVSLGNQVDVGETDVLIPVAADPDTQVITLYMEGVQDGRRFIETAQTVTREKPIVALKVGRSVGARQAVASHTGALAGQDSAFAAAFRQAGIIRADTSEELFDWARALAWCPLPKGRRVAVLTNAGGPGVTAIDALDMNGLMVAHLTEKTRQELKKVLPPAANVYNPVDMLAGASPEQYATSLRLLLEDGGVDSVLVILPPPPMHTAGAVARTIIPIIYTSPKPVVVALMGERLIQEAVEHFRAARVPEYRFPERAAAALAILCDRAEYLAEERQEAVRPQGIDHAVAARILAEQDETDGFLPPQVVNDLLRAYGIRVPEMGMAHTTDEAVQWAKRVGYPVVLKIVAAEIVHKSDIGCVRLNLTNETEVREAFATIMANGWREQPAAAIEGVSVQPMIPTGHEVIIGAVQDPQFGAMLMFGSGGVEVEQLKDVAFALAPLTEREAKKMLAQTWAGRRLQGYRHLAAGDEAQTVETLLRLGQLAADWSELVEIEINPLRVLAPGQGVVAVDARARLMAKSE